MDSTWRSVKHAIRSFRRSPGLVAIATLSLALGISSNVTIFTAVNRLIWNALPYPDPDRLVQLWGVDSTQGWTDLSVSTPDFVDWRRQIRGATIAAHTGTSFNFTEADRPERLFAEQTSADFLSVLQVRPALGRAFRVVDEDPGAARVAMLSHRFWTRRFGADSTLIGGSILLDSEPYQVVGVLPESFRWGDNSTDVWVPLRLDPSAPRGTRSLRVIGRLEPGTSVAQLSTEVAHVATRLAGEYPSSNKGLSGRAMLLSRELVEEQPRQGAAITMFAVFFVLLIACANVANLLLARATGRDRELAVRAALGADRRRLVRELLTESIVLALIGGGLGVILSIFGVTALKSIIPANLIGLDRLRLDWAALGFALAVSLVSGLLFGIAPAWRSARPNLATSLRDGARGMTGLRHGRMLAGFVVVEVALALVLLISAGLLIKGSIAIQRVDPGFDQESALTFRTALSEPEYPDSNAVVRFQEELLQRVAGLDGVAAAGAVTSLPYTGGSGGWYQVDGQPEPGPGLGPVTQVRGVTPGYLAAIGIELRAGREVASTDRFETPRVALINETLAKRHWPDKTPLGARIRVWDQWWTVVGVIEDTREFGVDDPSPPVMLVPVTQTLFRRLTYVARTTREPTTLTVPVREAVRSLAPNQPIYEVKTLQAHFERDLRQIHVMPQLLGFFGFVALLLAVIGVYGVIAYAVAQRTQEMGVRRALGAQGGNITGLVLRGAMAVCGLGVLVGLALASLATRGLASFLFGVSAFDPAVFAGVTAALLGAAFVAALIPAWRATRIDPIVALKAD